MLIQTIVDAVKWAWCNAPFPWLLVLVVLVSVVWLWLEYQLTRLGRKTPGVNRPIPILPEISQVAVYGIQLSWLLVRLWAIIFIIMLAVSVAAKFDVLPDKIARSVSDVGQYWRLGTIWIVDKLPDAIGDHLTPATSCSDPWPQNTHTPESEAQDDKLESLVIGRTPTPVVLVHPTTAPTATPTPPPAFQIIVLKNANVRAGPGTNEPRIGRAEAGDRYVVTGRNGDSTWWRILYNGKTGWIWHELVDSNAVPKSIPVFGP